MTEHDAHAAGDAGARSPARAGSGPRPSETGETLPERPACPFCDGRDTELISPFGSVLSVAGYWCRDCHTGFEYVKWGDARR